METTVLGGPPQIPGLYLQEPHQGPTVKNKKDLPYGSGREEMSNHKICIELYYKGLLCRKKVSEPYFCSGKDILTPAHLAFLSHLRGRGNVTGVKT